MSSLRNHQTKTSLRTPARRRTGKELEALVAQRTAELTRANESLRAEIAAGRRGQEASAMLAAIVESSEDAIFSKTLDGTIRTWNAGAQRMFGYRPEEAIGQPGTLLIPPERVEEEEQVLARLKAREQIDHFETVRVTKDGQRLNVSLTISPMRDPEGRLIGASRIARDIGEMVQARQVLAQSKADLERLVNERTAKLREALAELEHMSYSMVHDMRAPLRAMQGFATILQEECADCLRPAGLDYLQRLRESANRLDLLLTDALQYSQVVRQELPLRSVELGKLLRGMLATYPNLNAQAADIRLEFGNQVVLGNESLLAQCFANLLDNAVKFVPPGVKPHIRIWAEPAGVVAPQAMGASERETFQPDPAPPSTLQPRTVRIWLEDNGIGIPQAAQERIFRMFQRMHGPTQYPGTGIGLAIVRKATERMGGRVGVESGPGQGSRFWIELPIP